MGSARREGFRQTPGTVPEIPHLARTRRALVTFASCSVTRSGSTVRSVRQPTYRGGFKARETRSRTDMSEQQKAGANSDSRSGRTADPKADAKRQAALHGALTQIERQFGKGTVMRMGDPGARVAVDAIPTGALPLDLALGIGGVPRGRIIEIFGPESSGKTTLVYHILAEAQKLGGVCAFIDAEHAMDPLYAQQIGVDIDELLVSQPD